MRKGRKIIAFFGKGEVKSNIIVGAHKQLIRHKKWMVRQWIFWLSDTGVGFVNQRIVPVIGTYSYADW